MDREDAWSMSVQVEEGVGDAVRTMPYMQISATSWTSFENSQQPQRVGFLQPCSHSAGVGGEHGERVLSFAGDSFFARILLGLLKIFSWFSILNVWAWHGTSQKDATKLRRWSATQLRTAVWSPVRLGDEFLSLGGKPMNSMER